MTLCTALRVWIFILFSFFNLWAVSIATHKKEYTGSPMQCQGVSKDRCRLAANNIKIVF